MNDDEVLKALEDDLRKTHPALAQALSDVPARKGRQGWLKRLESRAQERWDKRKERP